jgi:hypothetical protein
MTGSTLFCFVIALLAIGLIFFIEWRKRSERDAAQAAYHEALRALKAKPTSADLRQQALARGRAYSNLTRNRRGVTVYDEMAVMNDIQAATAGATAAASAPTPVAMSATSVEDRLKRLDELRAKGIVNDQEYEERRRKILEEL